MTRRNRTLACFLFIALTATSCLAWGQASTAGELSGTVIDPSGAVIPGAVLTITQPSTGFTRSATASANGS